MARPRGDSRAWVRRHHRFIARFQLHHRRPKAEDHSREAAARAISGGDFHTRTPRELDHGIEYLFTSAEQAHAMQIWLEANATPYDPRAERLESLASSHRRMKEIADLINGAAATGALDRLRGARVTGGSRAAAALLQEIEPRFDAMEADQAVGLLLG